MAEGRRNSSEEAESSRATVPDSTSVQVRETVEKSIDPTEAAQRSLSTAPSGTSVPPDEPVHSDDLVPSGGVTGRRRGFVRRFSNRHPRLTSWALFVLILGIWGVWAGPGWNPQPMRAMIVPETSDTTITTTTPTAEIGTYTVETSVVDVTMRDGTTVPATVKRPVGVEGLAPGVVLVHGTGTASYRSFVLESEQIASTGIVTLVPEKRIDNYTTTHRDYEALARDYEDAYDYLLSLDEVDPHRSGLYGVSEGCFVAPIVAVTKTEGVSFVVLVSAPVLPIRQQGALAADNYLRNLGAPIQIINAIPRLIGQDFGDNVFDYIDFDVSVYQQQMTMPVLMLYGTGDMSMPTVQGPLEMREDLAVANNTHLTVRYYADADHGLKVAGTLLTEAMRDTADWINGMPDTAAALPQVAGAQPKQDYVAGDVGRTHWFASGQAAVIILVVGVALTAVGALLGLIGRLRIAGRRLADTGGCGGTVYLASIAVVTAWVAIVAYVVAVATLATSYQQNRWIVQGGWLAVQLLALASAWCVVRVHYAWREARYRDRSHAPQHAAKGDRRKEHGQINALGQAVIAVSLIGQVTLIVALAYWGPFPALF
ncbi:acyl-CoA thioester hydrolase/BAAT C-terminal domain-containing protein [Actinobaculum sp. 352]|uniref:alpha/beta hydrolase family protein n=1 Tax=Actinobaculum sp. 352 TaxID=2490946 RepID=UPI000F7F95E5|nr:acyl-CoA thioester hydrolase/BAAT C-terminal domain-containing protein [Actinobaculum sp. 352]RTE50870.1 alpha/beta hydrolase [Actinobaculum sp. 352]